MHRSVCYWLYERFRGIAFYVQLDKGAVSEIESPIYKKTEVAVLGYLSFSSSFAISWSYFACSASYSFCFC